MEKRKKFNLYKTERAISPLYRTCWNIYGAVLKKIKFAKEDKILDAGCGEGLLGRYLKKNLLYGIDLSKGAIEKAKNQNYQNLKRGLLEKLPYKDKEFDKTISIEVFQYLENPYKVFKELIRVTKGHIIIVVPNFKWFYIKSLFMPKTKKWYKQISSQENITSVNFLKKLAKKENLNLKIYYISNKFGPIRNLFGNFFSSAIIGVYNEKA